MKRNGLFLCFFCTHFLVFAQKPDSRVKIAILDFAKLGSNTANKDSLNDIAYLREMVNNEFAQKPGFIILDRTVFSKITDELNLETNESFINSKLVDAGKQYGAEYIVTGVINQYEHKMIKTPQYVLYTVNISFSIKLIDVTTGQLAYEKTITGSQTSSTIANALNMFYSSIFCDVKHAVLTMFPSEIHIIKVDEIDKKGKLKKVLVDKGEELFADNVRNSPCNGGWLSVILIEDLDVNGVKYKTEKEIGMLQVDKTEGSISSCVVVKGDKEIMENFTNGKPLKIKFL